MPSVVQSNAAQAIGLTVSTTLGSNIRVGNSIVVTVTDSRASGSTSTLSDAGGNTYILLVSEVQPGLGETLIFWCPTTTVQPGAITATSLASGLMSICAVEVSEIYPGTPLGSPTFQGATGNAVSPVTCLPAIVVPANSFVIGCLNLGPTTSSITDEAGWTNLCSLRNESIGSFNDTQYIISPAASVSASWTVASTAGDFVAAAGVAFRPTDNVVPRHDTIYRKESLYSGPRESFTGIGERFHHQPYGPDVQVSLSQDALQRQGKTVKDIPPFGGIQFRFPKSAWILYDSSQVLLQEKVRPRVAEPTPPQPFGARAYRTGIKVSDSTATSFQIVPRISIKRGSWGGFVPYQPGHTRRSANWYFNTGLEVRRDDVKRYSRSLTALDLPPYTPKYFRRSLTLKVEYLVTKTWHQWHTAKTPYPPPFMGLIHKGKLLGLGQSQTFGVFPLRKVSIGRTETPPVGSWHRSRLPWLGDSAFTPRHTRVYVLPNLTPFTAKVYRGKVNPYRDIPLPKFRRSYPVLTVIPAGKAKWSWYPRAEEKNVNRPHTPSFIVFREWPLSTGRIIRPEVVTHWDTPPVYSPQRHRTADAVLFGPVPYGYRLPYTTFHKLPPVYGAILLPQKRRLWDTTFMAVPYHPSGFHQRSGLMQDQSTIHQKLHRRRTPYYVEQVTRSRFSHPTQPDFTRPPHPTRIARLQPPAPFVGYVRRGKLFGLGAVFIPTAFIPKIRHANRNIESWLPLWKVFRFHRPTARDIVAALGPSHITVLGLFGVEPSYLVSAFGLIETAFADMMGLEPSTETDDPTASLTPDEWE